MTSEEQERHSEAVEAELISDPAEKAGFRLTCLCSGNLQVATFRLEFVAPALRRHSETNPSGSLT